MITGDIAPDVEAELVLLQHQRIGARIPTLYLTIGVVAIVAGLGSDSEWSLLYHLFLPMGFCAMGIYRTVAWRRRQTLPIDPASARRYLYTTTIIAIMMSLIGGFWGLHAYLGNSEARRVLAPIFIFMISFAGAVCITSLPRAAISVLFAALSPSIIAMLFSDDLGIRTMGICMAIVACLLMVLIISHFREIINSLELRKELQILAETDALTGVANRRAFAARFEDMRDDITASTPLAVIMIDLNGFKDANDRFGHAAGDAILIEVAERLEILCKDIATVARLGGDEFALLLAIDDQDYDHYGRDLQQNVRETLALPYHGEDQQVHISASVGIAFCPDHGDTLSLLMHHADLELYLEKQKFHAALRANSPQVQNNDRRSA